MDRRQKHRELVRALEGRKRLEEFRAWLLFRRYAERSIGSYLKNVRLIAVRLGGVRKLATATTKELEEVFSTSWSASHHNQIRQALVLYYRFLGAEKNPAEQLPALRRPQHLPRPYSPEETVRYLTAAAELGRRYAVLAGLGVYAGLRIHEASKLAWADVTGRYVIVTGKGGKQRNVPIHPELGAVLGAWRKECPSKRFVLPPKETIGGGRKNHLTWSPENDRAVNRNTAYDWHVHILERAGLRRHEFGRDGFHRTRHTSATALLRATSDLRKVQRFLGHSSPATTALYTLVEDDQLYEGVAKISWSVN